MGFPFAMFDYWRVIQIRFSTKDGFRTFSCELSYVFIIFKMLTLCLFNIAMKHRSCYGCLFHDQHDHIYVYIYMPSKTTSQIHRLSIYKP